jgi:hypothetical protein
LKGDSKHGHDRPGRLALPAFSQEGVTGSSAGRIGRCLTISAPCIAQSLALYKEAARTPPPLDETRMTHQRIIFAFLAALSLNAMTTISLAAQPLYVLPRDAKGAGIVLAPMPRTYPVPLAGWFVCNGAPISRSENAELFSAIGERFGPGDGVTTFNLPSFPLEMRLGQPYRGHAVNPRTGPGGPAGAVFEFVIDPGT